jgi:hypothetical protein
MHARFVCASILLLAATVGRADPWLAPGAEGVRSDIQRLADAGILRGPVTTWPLSWPDVARDALGASTAGLDSATLDALVRIQRLSRDASAQGYSGAGYRVAAAADPAALRAFGDSPREDGELAVRASWLSNHFAVNLQGTAVANADDKTFRADGSYLGINLGNFMISAGYMERWWGPGWDGSLILSTNARPIPSLTLERNYTDPFKTKLLSWIGPWRASIAVGQSEEDDLELRNVRFLAARVNFKPRPWLEFGVSRTAQWCGGDRPCGWGVFKDLLLGHDNQVEGGAPVENQPGNQMAGYDMRLRSPWRRIPAAFYTQWIGEDEAGGLPSKFLGLFGLEVWGSSPLGGWRVHAEYADTACNFSRERPNFDCAYRNAIYSQGYSNWGRPIGDALDNDSRMYSIAAILNRADGSEMSLSLRRAEINRDGAGPHAISAAPLNLDNVELRYSRALWVGHLSVGLGYGDPGNEDVSTSRVHGFLSWQQGF